MKRQTVARSVAAAVLALGLAASGALAAHAYSPVPGTIYSLPDNQPCLKGRFNCAIYPKAAQLPNGQMIASFEQATVPASGTAVGETFPIYRSSDDGTSWSRVSEVKAPAFLSNNSAFSKYTSAWGNPYFYVLPQQLGSLSAGTLLMAGVVTGEDEYYREQKAANPNFVPDGDGDRRDLALALYASTDNGTTWTVLNIIATGGWQGGSAGNFGRTANANTYRQIDPVWEPFLMVYNNQLVAYYSDENDYTGYNTTTGVPTLRSDNATAADGVGQILVHKTWTGSGAWSSPVVDVTGTTFQAAGRNVIGGGRPGMTNVAKLSDGKWMITFEYFGGGDNVHYKVSSDPLRFFAVGGEAGSNITSLPVSAGSGRLSTGGSPVVVTLPDGRVVFNAAGSGSVWVNSSGSSTGTWTQYQTTMPGGYSRNLTWNSRTGRVVILGNRGVSNIINADVDLGRSAGTYYRIVNRRTGQVIGTNGNITDANLGAGDTPDVRLEAQANTDTQLWHVTTKSDGSVVLLNRAGGRSASVWTGSATAGQRIGSWVDDTASGPYRMFSKSNGDVYFQSTANTSLYLTGSASGSGLTLQVSDNGGGTQDWQLVAQ